MQVAYRKTAFLPALSLGNPWNTAADCSQNCANNFANNVDRNSDYQAAVRAALDTFVTGFANPGDKGHCPFYIARHKAGYVTLSEFSGKTR